LCYSKWQTNRSDALPLIALRISLEGEQTDLCCLCCLSHSSLVQFSRSDGVALACHASGLLLEDCSLNHNSHGAIRCTFASQCQLFHCEVKDNGDQPFLIDEDTLIQTSNCIGDVVSEEFLRDHTPPAPPPSPTQRDEEHEEILIQRVEEVPEEIAISTKSVAVKMPRKRRQHSLDSDIYERDAGESDEDYEEEERQSKSAKKRQRKFNN
jgi:hypothetical protein